MTQLQELIAKAKQSLDMATCDLMEAHELASPIEQMVVGFALDNARHALDSVAQLEAVICGDTDAVAT